MSALDQPITTKARESVMTVVAEPVSWQGLTGKWGRRWIAQVLKPGEVVYTCPHGHALKRDAKACGEHQRTLIEMELP